VVRVGAAFDVGAAFATCAGDVGTTIAGGVLGALDVHDVSAVTSMKITQKVIEAFLHIFPFLSLFDMLISRFALISIV
jgi:hypothetical protein